MFKAIILTIGLITSQQAISAALDATYIVGRPTNNVSLGEAILAAAKGQTVFKCEETQLKGTSSGVSFKKKPKVEDNPFKK